MKKIFITFLILFIILVVSIYMVLSYRNKNLEIQKLNREYEKYYNIEILGTELISIINRTIDLNNKNDIVKDENGYFVNNEETYKEIYIEFIYKDKTKLIQMEDIEKSGIETFVKVYSTASFKCTDIKYHDKTKNVKSLTFTEILENN